MSETLEQLLPLAGELGAHYRVGDGAEYLPDDALVHAARAALALNWPLLLNGEPGTGKSDFARAVASHWAHLRNKPADEVLLPCYVRSDTTSRDLLYTYDALRRFGEAQHGDSEEKARARDARHYIELAGLGRGLAETGLRVVLIDEIDKAPRDLPNDLLREMEHGDFEIAEIPQRVTGEVRWQDRLPLTRKMGPSAPDGRLVVITSNNEKPLPEPFLRRCAYHYVEFPKPERLAEILRRHVGGPMAGAADAALRAGAVHHFTALREQLQKKPSTAELIGWVKALVRAGTDEDRRKVADKGTGLADLPLLACVVKRRDDEEMILRRFGSLGDGASR